MAEVTPDQLEAYLTEYGWTFEAHGLNLWTTGFQGERRTFPMNIRWTPTCLSFEVRPYLDLGVDWPRSPELARDLLELNARMQLVKVGLSETGEVLLSCQVLVAGFDYECFGRILGIIGYYADELAPEIYSKVEIYDPERRPTLLS